MTHHLSLRKEGEAIFDMSLGNRQHRGLFVSLLTAQAPTSAALQFDDFGETKRWKSISEAIGDIIDGNLRGEDIGLRRISEGRVIWRPDDHYATSGQERGFLAFQKTIREGVLELLCMVAKKDSTAQDPEDKTLSMHSVIFSPTQSQEDSREYPIIGTPPTEWRILCYIVEAMRRAADTPTRVTHKPVPPLVDALKNPEAHFSTTFLPENIARIQSVFGI